MIKTVVILTILLCGVKSAPLSLNNGTFNLTILHNNDIHGRFEQVDVHSDVCTAELASLDKCYGGFARTAHLIREFRKKSENSKDSNPVLFLNAGDLFTGTVWSLIFKEKISLDLMNYLLPNATTFGNHEFDYGLNTLKNLISNSSFPFVVSNLDLTKVKTFASLDNLVKSVVLDVRGRKVGIVGYVTPETMLQAPTAGVVVLPELEAVNEEASKLKAAGVDIIIALAHSGFEKDKEIARQSPDLDVIVGGHTNTFLYNNAEPDEEKAEGPYPFVVEQESGRKVLVVQAFAYTKYLGVLNLQFDSRGEVQNWSGNPILINATIPQDQDVLDALEKYRPNVTALAVPVGVTNVFLNGTKGACRKGECNLGNVFADAILFARERDLLDRFQTLDTYISLVLSGGIKKSISNITHNGEIMLQDVLTALPHKNILYVANISGTVLRRALEHSARHFDMEENGGYLQFSGLKVVFDMKQPGGQRVVSVQVKTEPWKYEPLDLSVTYKVVMSEFLMKGGDGFKWTVDGSRPQSELMKWNDLSALIEYFKVFSPVSIGLEGRQEVRT